MTNVIVKSKMSSIAPYQQIERDLERRIDSGEWAPGIMIPSRRALAEEYNVELSTVQRAISGLLKRELLRADGGRGTFVAFKLRKVGHGNSGKMSQPDARLGATAQGPSLAAAGSVGSPRSQYVVGIVASVPPEYAIQAPTTDAWQSLVVNALELELGREPGITVNYHNRISSIPDAPLISTFDGLRSLVAEGVNAIVIISVVPEHIDEILIMVDPSRVPVVLVTPDYVSNRLVPHIRYDNANAGFLAADHMLQRGYRSLTFFAPFTGPWGDERLSGIREALRRNGYSDSTLEVSDCDRTINPGIVKQEDVAYPYAAKMFDSIDRNRLRSGWGIIAINDHAAEGLMRAAAERGLVAGRDFGVISFDDLSRSRTLGLSSLRAPYDQMGYEAGRIIRRFMNGEQLPMEVSLQSNVVARKSTTPVMGDTE